MIQRVRAVSHPPGFPHAFPTASCPILKRQAELQQMMCRIQIQNSKRTIRISSTSLGCGKRACLQCELHGMVLRIHIQNSKSIIASTPGGCGKRPYHSTRTVSFLAETVRRLARTVRRQVRTVRRQARTESERGPRAHGATCSRFRMLSWL